MFDLITAVHTKQVLSCMYDGKPRVIEPHAYGLSIKDGSLILRCYQQDGESNTSVKAWKLFSVAKMENIEVVSGVSEAPRLGYKPGDKYMSQILAELPA